MKCALHQIEIGRYGPCTLCLMEKEGGAREFARHFMGVRTFVICACVRDGEANPSCLDCNGSGEKECAPF